MLFLRGVLRRYNHLLRPAIGQLAQGIQNYSHLIVKGVFRHGKGCTVAEMIDECMRSQGIIQHQLNAAFNLIGPTGSPREFLLRLIFSEPATISKLPRDYPHTIGKFEHCFCFFTIHVAYLADWIAHGILGAVDAFRSVLQPRHRAT